MILDITLYETTLSILSYLTLYLGCDGNSNLILWYIHAGKDLSLSQPMRPQIYLTNDLYATTTALHNL